MLDITLIILSAGESSRFKHKTKKQWLFIEDEPLWLHVTKKINSFYNFKDVVVVSNKNELFYMQNFCNFKIIEGGNTRQQSLKNALLHVKTQYVIVSDVARANISKSIVLNLIENINNYDCIAPYLNIYDTTIYDNEAVERSLIKLIQTPQLSLTKSLQNALETNSEFTDDSSAIKANGGKVNYIIGDNKAKKITLSDDLKTILNDFKKPNDRVFVGFGYDVHAYEENKVMFLGGIKINENIGFRAHSDGDVVIHAIIDALLGAIGAGDIGEWFPDTTQDYKNVNSTKLLEKIVSFVLHVGYEINNIDISIVAEFPKISPYKKEMSENLAKMLDIPTTRVNVKATTSEKMGFIGRREGIGVYAVASLKYFDWTK